MFVLVLSLCSLAYCEDVPKDGIYKEYYDSGKLKFEESYKNGALDGVLKVYFENGNPMSETNYVEGKKEGV